MGCSSQHLTDMPWCEASASNSQTNFIWNTLLPISFFGPDSPAEASIPGGCNRTFLETSVVVLEMKLWTFARYSPPTPGSPQETVPPDLLFPVGLFLWRAVRVPPAPAAPIPGASLSWGLSQDTGASGDPASLSRITHLRGPERLSIIIKNRLQLWTSC